MHNVISYHDVYEDEAEDDNDEGYKTEDDDVEDVHCFGCGHALESSSAMLVHLESGNSGCRTTRDDLNRLALARHTSNRFVVRGGEESLRRGQGYRRARQSYFNQRTQYWECPWCNFSSTSLWGLDMHLLSPVHDVKASIYPDQECKQLFVNSSGLVAHVMAHVESERCEEVLWEGGQAIGRPLGYLGSSLWSGH